MLVAQNARRVEVRTKHESEWATQVFEEGEIVDLSSIDAKLDVDALYSAASQPA